MRLRLWLTTVQICDTTLLLVDYRDGSKQLAPALERLGLPVFRNDEGGLPTIEFGDLAFIGRGPDDKPLDIGVEFKQVGEMASSFRSDRFAGFQLPGMLHAYDHSWLVIEGEWQADHDGYLVVKGKFGRWVQAHGRITAAEFEKRLLVLGLQHGVYVWPTRARSDTLRFLATLYRAWTDKAVDEHRSTDVVYHKPLVSLRPVTRFCETVTTFPNVGLTVARAAEKVFGTIRAAVNASEAQWAAITTTDRNGKNRRVGTSDARSIVDWMNT